MKKYILLLAGFIAYHAHVGGMEQVFQKENAATQKLAKKLCKAIYNDDIPYVKNAIKNHHIMHVLVSHFAFHEEVSAIHVAAAENEECLKLLLQHGASPVIRTRQFEFSPLHYASSATAAQLLVQHGAPIDQKDGTGQTPFFHCMHLRNDHSRYARARFFLQEGADRNVADAETGDTPLHCAHESKMVNFLLGNGADASLKNKLGETPFEENCEYIAGSEFVFTECGNFFFPPQDRLDQPWMHDLFLSQCQHAISLINVNDHVALKAYIEEYPFITSYDDVCAQKMLYAAIQQPDGECLNIVLTKQINSDVEFCENYGEEHVCTQDCKSRGNALHAAIFFGNTAAIHLLVPYKADILMRDACGRTPMEYALAVGKPHCVAALNEALSVHFVSSMIADNAGHEYGMYQKCKNILSQIHQINAQCPFSGSTLLHQACYFACDTKLRYVSLLLAAGADLYMRDHKGRTPLFSAVRSLSKKVCELVLVFERLLKGITVPIGGRAQDKKPLNWINLADNKGRSALHYATVNLCIFISIPLLLQYGARVTQEILDSSCWHGDTYKMLREAYIKQQVSNNEKI